jgi:hypothetical protein
MSDKPDLVFNEAQSSGWLRAEFYGDEEAAKGYIDQARQVLGSMRIRHGVNERIAEGQPGGFFRADQVLPDGTRIETLTNDGHDTVRITASSQLPAAPVPREIPLPASTSFEGEGTRFAFEPPVSHKEPEYRPLTREYCVWEPDQEAYSPPLFGHHTYGPMVNDTDTIYMGGWLNGPYVGPAFTHVSVMYLYDPDTLAQGGAFELAFPPLYTQRMQWDSGTGRFFLLDGQGAYAVNSYTIYGVTYWDAKNGPARVTFPSSADPNVSIHERYTDISPGTINGLLLANFSSQTSNDLYGIDTKTLTQGTTMNYGAGFGALAACPTPDGDLIVVETDTGASHISGVRRIGIATGKSLVYPLPPTENVYLVEIVCDQGGALWLLQSVLTPPISSIVVYRYDPGAANPAWETVTVDGGFGTRDMSVMQSLANDVWTDYDGGIQYDPVSDAVVVLMADGSGAWVVSAVDCLGVPIPEFFYPFAKRPDPATYVATRGQQLYNGRLLVRYEEAPHNIGIQSDTVLEGHNVIGASYVIGMLRQTKIQEDAGVELDLSAV